MKNLIDDDLILEILNIFAEEIDNTAFDVFERIEHTEINKRHFIYLVDHGFVKNALGGLPYRIDREGKFYTAAPMTLTKEGIDFLLENGGLTAKKNTITVRFEVDTIKQLIEAKIEASNISEKEKNSLKAHLKSLPKKILEGEMLSLLQMGLHQIPIHDIMLWLPKL